MQSDISIQLQSEKRWTCQRCTFLNNELLQSCEMCGTSVDDNTNYPCFKPSVFELVGNTKFEEVVKNNTILSKRRRDKNDNIISQPRSNIIRTSYNEPICDPNLLPEATTGILELVSMVNYQQKIRCITAYPSCLHYQQGGSYGAAWSCGYRNIQMLCSCLMGVPEFRARLFSGEGVVPPIFHLQQFIESAWKAGFDSQGAMHFKHKLVGKSAYIGTTECAALLRYFRIRAVIVDFPCFPQHSEEEKEENNMGNRLFQWLQKYFDHKWEESSFKSCLYFQHDGHSQTISGVRLREGSNDIESVIIFDPAVNGKVIKQSLLDGNFSWQRQLLRRKTTFKKAEYQLLYISPGLMDNEEYERSKVIVGDVEMSGIRKTL